MTDINKIQEAIFKTLCWFDVFDYPLMLQEIWRYGFFTDKCDLAEVGSELEILLMQKRIEYLDSYYFLPERGGIVAERQKRFKFAEQKINRAAKFSRIFRFIPSIELIALGNQIGSRNMREGSDIDLLIVTKPGTIWTTRFLTAGLVKLLGVRPTANNSKDTICLSFYATSEALNFKSIAETDFHYFYYWLAFLMPIYDRDGVYEKLMQENNWIIERLPNFVFDNKTQVIVKVRKCYLLQWLLTPMYLLEGQLRKLQLKIMPNGLSDLANQDTRVVVSDQMLKFHANDRRRAFQEKYMERIIKFNAG